MGYIGEDRLKDLLTRIKNTFATKDSVAAKQDTLIAGTNITIAEDGKTISATAGNTINGINDIGDVAITSASANQVLKYDATNSKWINGDAPQSASTWSELTDKPFTSLDPDSFEVDNESGVLSVVGGGTSSISILTEDITSQCEVSSKFSLIKVHKCGGIIQVRLTTQTSATSADYEPLVILPSKYTIVTSRLQIINNVQQYFDTVIVDNNKICFRSAGTNIDDTTCTFMIMVMENE